jgi:hypothetical protein
MVNPPPLPVAETEPDPGAEPCVVVVVCLGNVVATVVDVRTVALVELVDVGAGADVVVEPDPVVVVGPAFAAGRGVPVPQPAASSITQARANVRRTEAKLASSGGRLI